MINSYYSSPYCSLNAVFCSILSTIHVIIYFSYILFFDRLQWSFFLNYGPFLPGSYRIKANEFMLCTHKTINIEDYYFRTTIDEWRTLLQTSKWKPGACPVCVSKAHRSQRTTHEYNGIYCLWHMSCFILYIASGLLNKTRHAVVIEPLRRKRMWQIPLPCACMCRKVHPPSCSFSLFSMMSRTWISSPPSSGFGIINHIII